jgi:hypothetical protein
MKKTSGSSSYSKDLSHLSITIAELFQQGVAEISACSGVENEMLPELNLEEHPDSYLFPEVGFPCRSNPFDATLIAFDRKASKLTFLLSLTRPLMVVAEIYGLDGRFIKRLFIKKIGRGLTEVVGLGCWQLKGTFVILLQSYEGMRSFRITQN